MYIDYLQQRLVMKSTLKKHIISLLGYNYNKLTDYQKDLINEAVQQTCSNFIKPTRRHQVIITLAGDIITGLGLEDLKVHREKPVLRMEDKNQMKDQTTEQATKTFKQKFIEGVMVEADVLANKVATGTATEAELALYYSLIENQTPSKKFMC